MPKVKESFLSQLKQGTIEAVVSSYLSLKKSGSSLIACCPFHKESTPSFHVHPEEDYWYCFGCSEGGDVLRFVEKIEGCSFTDAVKKTASLTNVSIEYETTGDTYSLLSSATSLFKLNLKESKIAQEYLKQRIILSQTIEQFSIGYAPNDWHSLSKELKRQGYTEEQLLEAGLIAARKTQGYYDCFRNRIMIPVLDANSRVIGFIGRAIDNQKPKYLLTPESSIFKKKKCLFGLGKEEREIVLVEGQFDAIKLRQSGFPAVATMGTALNQHHVDCLTRHAQKVIVAFDNDEAGQTALTKLEGLKWGKTEVLVAHFEGSKDPDEFIGNGGDFGEVLSKASVLIKEKENPLSLSFPPKKSTKKEKALEVIASILYKYPELYNNQVPSTLPQAKEIMLSDPEAMLWDAIRAVEREELLEYRNTLLKELSRNPSEELFKKLQAVQECL